MNFHQVATPELGVDEARFYIFFFREGDKLSAYIVLYMPNSERRVYYSYSSNPFPEADLSNVEDIARAFGEDMGFFLDEKSFAASSIAEKNRWIDEQPLFGFKSPKELELADALQKSEATAAPEAEQPPAPAGAADEVKSAIPEAPAPSFVQTAPPAPVPQPLPAAPTAQPVPPPPSYYQPVPPPPITQPAPTAPVYQPAPVAPVAPQIPAQPVYQKEVEIESQVEAEAEAEEEEVDTRPLRRKSAAVQPPAEKLKAAVAVPRTALNPNKEEPHAPALKNPIPAHRQILKKETREVLGVVGREMEALARLMASF
jgi:hypothetical protein